MFHFYPVAGALFHSLLSVNKGHLCKRLIRLPWKREAERNFLYLLTTYHLKPFLPSYFKSRSKQIHFLYNAAVFQFTVREHCRAGETLLPDLGGLP